MLGNLVGQKAYVGVDATAVTTRDDKLGDRILAEPALRSSYVQTSATAGFAF